MGGSISIVNETKHNLAICLCQVGPLYYDNCVKPGDKFYRKTGAVHFTIRAWINDDGNVNPVTQMDVLMPFWNGITSAAIILSFAAKSPHLNKAVPTVSSGLGSIRTACDTVDKKNFLTSVMATIIELTKQTSIYSPGWYAGFNHELVIRGGFNEATKTEELRLYDKQGRKVA